MNRASSDTNSSLEGLAVGMRSLEKGQKGRVDIDQSSSPFANKFSSQNSHESSQANNLHTSCSQLFVQFSVEL